MNITVVGRGAVGGGLTRLWRSSGHSVQALGRRGGDASEADVLVIAVPSSAIVEALAKVSGISGKSTIDATNPFGSRQGFESLTHLVRSIVGGPTAKAFNLNWPELYDTAASQAARPGNLYASESAVREVVESLSRDAGFDPISVGGIENARVLEDMVALVGAVRQGGMGPFFYRMWEPRIEAQ